MVCQRWFSREDYSVKVPHWLSPQTIQEALKLYIVRDPRDRLLLSVKATEDGADITSQVNSRTLIALDCDAKDH